MSRRKLLIIAATMVWLIALLAIAMPFTRVLSPNAHAYDSDWWHADISHWRNGETRLISNPLNRGDSVPSRLLVMRDDYGQFHAYALLTNKRGIEIYKRFPLFYRVLNCASDDFSIVPINAPKGRGWELHCRQTQDWFSDEIESPSWDINGHSIDGRFENIPTPPMRLIGNELMVRFDGA